MTFRNTFGIFALYINEPKGDNKNLNKKKMSRFRETRMVSFRLEESTIKMLDLMAKRITNGNRTWCVENVINEQFKTFTSNEVNKITEENKNEK